MSADRASIRSPLDPVPPHQRVAVAGATGIGKSTLCHQLAKAWKLPYTELDSLFQAPDGTQRPSFVEDVEHLIARDSWVSEVSYFGPGVGSKILARAELLLWLDYPSSIAATRLLRRTLTKRLRGADRPGGSMHPPLRALLSESSHALRWEMSTHGLWRERIPRVQLTHPDLAIIRFGHPRETAAWVAGLGDPDATA